VYGDGPAIGNINYSLLIVCRKTTCVSIHGLQNLEQPSIRSAMLEFLLTINRHPKKMLADRDFKLIGKKIDT